MDAESKQTRAYVPRESIGWDTRLMRSGSVEAASKQWWGHSGWIDLVGTGEDGNDMVEYGWGQLRVGMDMETRQGTGGMMR